MKPRCRVAQATVSAAHGINAVSYIAVGLLFGYIGVRLTLAFSSSWIMLGIAAFVGLNGVVVFIRGWEIFLGTRPPENQDARLRHLRSRSLYVREEDNPSRSRQRDA